MEQPRRRRRRPKSSLCEDDILAAATIKKILRRGGVKRAQSAVNREIGGIACRLLSEILKGATVYASYSRRKTINGGDIKEALKRMRMVYLG